MPAVGYRNAKHLGRQGCKLCRWHSSVPPPAPKKNRNFDTKLRFFFYAQKALNRVISQKKKSSVVILWAFIWVKIRHLIHFLNSQWNLSSKINAPLLTWNFVKAVHFAFQKTHHQSIEFSHRNERKNRKWVLIGYACYYPIELLFIPLCK